MSEPWTKEERNSVRPAWEEHRLLGIVGAEVVLNLMDTCDALERRAESAERDRDVLVAAMRREWMQFQLFCAAREADALPEFCCKHNLTREFFETNIAADAKEQK